MFGLVGCLAAVGAGIAGALPSLDGDNDEPRAGRGPCWRPYSAASPWNTLLGPAARYDEGREQYMRELDGELTSDPTQYTYPVYEVGPRTPVHEVRVHGVYSNVTARGRVLRIQKGGSVRLPVPAGASGASGSDAQIVLVNRRTGDEWGAWRVRREADGRLGITNGYHYNVRWSGVPPRDRSGRPFGSRGAGVPYLAGLVRACEIRRGRIDHALAFAYAYPSDEFVHPATKSDGAGGPDDLPEGTRLQLDPQISKAELRDWGCRGPCLTIATALQRYGMYVVDNSGRAKIMLEFEATAGWNGWLDDETVSPIPLSAFKVLREPGP